VIGDRLPKPSSGQASDARNPPSAHAVAVDTATRAPDVPEPDRLRRGARLVGRLPVSLHSSEAGGRAGWDVVVALPPVAVVYRQLARRGTFASLGCAGCAAEQPAAGAHHARAGAGRCGVCARRNLAWHTTNLSHWQCGAKFGAVKILAMHCCLEKDY
jgi:hypothetical protein